MSAHVTTQSLPIDAEDRPNHVLAAVAVVQFLVTLDVSIVNIALPEIGAGLGFSSVGLTWVINAYTLAFGGLLLLGGKAADRYGRKRVLLLGLAVFGLAALAGGLAQTPAQLIAARAAQGIGAAALAPAALSLLTATFPSGRARVRAFGVWSAVNASGGAFGVLVGGLLTEYAGWRWVMFVNVPMAVVALMLALRGIVRDRPHARRAGRPDVLGAILVTAGMTLLVLAVVRTDQHPWNSAVTMTTLGIAALLLALFVQVERTTAREPLLRLRLLANRSVAGANAYNLLFGAAMTSSVYFLTLYLQRVLDIGPALSGVMFLPFAFGIVTGSMLAVRLGYHLSPRTLLIGGGLLTAAGFAWLGLAIDPNGTFLHDVLGALIVASVGFGLCLGPVVSTATAGAAPQESGTASALLNSSRQIGSSLGLAVLGTIAYHYTGPIATAKTLTDGYALGLILDASLLVVAILVALIIPRMTSAKPLTNPTAPERKTTS